MKQNWTYKKLGDCFPYIKNGANIKQIKNADGLPITRIETLSGGVFNRDRMGYAGIHDLGKYIDYVLEDGDLLMSHINSKTYIGRTVEYKKVENETIIHGMNLLRLKSNKSLIDSSFMAYYTLSAEFKANVAKIRKDAVNQSSMAISDLKKFLIPLPPLSTQQSIVAELDEINNLLSLKRKELDAYDKLAQSLFYEMFGDPVDNEKGWEVKKYGDEFEIGSGGTPSKAKQEYWEAGNIPWIGSNMCQNIIITETDGKYITEEGLSHSSAKMLDEGTVLVALVGATIGKAALLKTSTSTNQNIAFIKVSDNSEYDSYFVFYHMMSLYDEFMNIGNGNFKMANLSFVRSLPIVKPPLSLQQTFATRIEAIEEQKANVKAAIEKLETLLAARMQYWFE